MTYIDLQYATPLGQPLHLDLYLPEDSGTPAPVIIWIHGGDWRGYDWMRGDKADCPVRSYVEKGYAVASVSYRLAPEARFPSQLIDCKAAVRWLRSRAKEFNLAPDQFAAWGFSGGALLASLMGATAGDAEFEQGDCLEYSSTVQAVVETCGAAYLYWGENTSPLAYWVTSYFNLQRNDFLRRLGIPPTEEALFGGPSAKLAKSYMRASPGSYVAKKDLAPLLLVTGTESRITPYMARTRYVKELRRESADATILYVNGKGQGGAILYEHPLVEAFLAEKLKGDVTRFHDNIGKINVASRSGEVSSYSEYQDESNTISMQSATLAWWDNPLRGFHHSLVEEGNCWSKALKSNIQYLVYLPPSYHHQQDRVFPTLYINTVGVITIDEHSLDFVELVRAAMLSGKMPEMIVVLPNNGFALFRERRIGVYLANRSEKALAKDFIPHIESTYRAIPGAEGRALQASCRGTIENIAFAVRGRKPLFSLVSASAPLYRPGLVRLLKRRKAMLTKDTILQFCHDPLDAFGVGAEGTKLVEAMNANDLSYRYFTSPVQGMHTWIEFALTSKENVFDPFIERFASFDPKFAQARAVTALCHRDLVYSERGDAKLTLDLYLPASPSGSVPLVIWAAGSDWRGQLFNHVDRGACHLESLTESGYAVACVQYRLASVAPFPAAVEDLQDAVAWLRSKEKDFGFDSTQIALAGDSAGGTLASLAALFSVDNPADFPAESRRRDLGIKAVICCGSPMELGTTDPMRWRDAMGGGAIHADRSSGVSQFLNGKDPAIASPLHYAHAGAPPHLFVHGALDTVVSLRQSGLMHKALVDRGACARLAIINDGGHGLGGMRDEALPLIHAFLDAKVMGHSTALASFGNELSPDVNELGSPSYPMFRDPVEGSDLNASYHVMPSAILGAEWSFLLSLPPGYKDEASRLYPVIYVLHDEGESPRDYLNYAMMRRDAEFAEAAPEALVVFVNGSSLGLYRDDHDGDRVESALVEELVPYVEAQWRARSDPASRILEGFGLGASAALRLAAKHPQVFGAVSAIAPRREPESWAGDGFAAWIERNAKASAQSICLQLVSIAGIPESVERIQELKSLLQTCGVPFRSLDSDLATSDALIGYLEGNFDVFAFQRDPSIARVQSDEIEMELI